MKRVDPILMNELLTEFTRRLGIDGDLRRVKVYQAWDDAVGGRAAHCTAKKFYRDKDRVLFCTMSSSSLANQLYFQSDVIKSRINDILQENLVEKVVIR